MTILLLLLFIIAFPTILNLLGLGVIFSYMVKLRVPILIAVIGIIVYVIYNIITGKTTIREAIFNTLAYSHKILMYIGVFLVIFMIFYILRLLFLF